MRRHKRHYPLMNTATAAMILALILAILILLLSAPAEAETMYCMCTPEGRVNIRSRATTHAGIIGYLYHGDSVTVLDRAKSGSGTWYRIDAATEAGTGWVSSAYLVSDPPAYSTSMATVEASGRVAIRKAPGGARSAWLYPGDEIRILATAGEWALTDRGYVMAKYLNTH